MRTALEILARRRGRRVARPAQGGYRVTPMATPDPRIEAFLVFAEHLYPNDVDRMYEMAHALAAGRSMDITQKQQRRLLQRFGGVRLAAGRSWWSRFWYAPGVGEAPVEVSTTKPPHVRAAAPCLHCGANYDEDCDAGLHG